MLGLLRWPLDWRLLVLLPIAGINLALVGVFVAGMLLGSDAVDFRTYHAAADRYGDGTLYESAEDWYGWRYSPLAVPLFWAVTWVGEAAWRLLHVAALVLLPGWARWVALASFPFWFDVFAGNVMTFVLVAAYWALRGNRWAIGIFLVLSLLIPRPLMLPIAAWLLWRHRDWIAPMGLVLVLNAVAVWVTGYADDWALVLVSTGSELTSSVNVGPSAFIGVWWMLIAVPLAAFFLWRGFPATSGLLLQPYWLPYYLLMPLGDLVRGGPAGARQPRTRRASRSASSIE